MKILVACEESQVVCQAFRDKGHEAYSCDIIPASGQHPEWHIQGDALKVLNEGWDMMIAHPPCTYLSNAGARHLFPKGVLNNERFIKGLEAKTFFMCLYNANIPKICVENPTPTAIYGLPKYTQTIQPWMFGHPFQKRTHLWLKGLPKLIPTNILTERQSTRVAGNWYNKCGKDRQRVRSRTFQGIAEAMAEQWGD